MKKQKKKHSIPHKILGGTIMVATIFLVGYVLLYLVAMLRNFCIDHPVVFIPAFIVIQYLLILIIKE